MCVLTCQRAGVPEGSYLRICETGEQGDDVVHHVLVIDDAVLALPHQSHHKLTEVGLELLPRLASHDQGVIAAVLKTRKTLFIPRQLFSFYNLQITCLSQLTSMLP